MLSLFKKVTRKYKSETCILEEFIENYSKHLSPESAEFHHVPHVRNQESDPIPTMVYKVTPEEVKILKNELWDTCERVIHEEGAYYMGIIHYAGRKIGFYLGLSHELEHEWARFWVE